MRIPVIETGPAGDEEAIVFLHGHPGSSRDWENLMSRVDFARAVAFDLPGFGKADKPEDWDYSIGADATFVAAALGVLGIERAHLVMHDLGGGAGLAWAAAHPGAFASAVIMSTGILIGFRWHPVARLYRVRGIGELMTRLTFRGGFRAAIRFYNPQPRKLPDWYIDQMWEDYDMGTRRAVLAMYRGAPASGFERLVPLFRELDRPALVLWGAKDPAVPVAQAELQRKSFPSAEVHVLEDSGHWAFIDDPEGVAARVVPFLRRQLVPAGAAA